MKCPLCNKATLVDKVREDHLKMKSCKTCGGNWLSSTSYWSWHDTLDQELPENMYSDINCDVTDSKKAKICPDCGRIMIRFKVGHGLDFSLDHCNNCNGVWFDKNEWEVLKSRYLHDEIHKIFMTAWQNEIKLEEKRKYFESSYRQKFGEDYFKIKTFKEWLDKHELKASILAFLADSKPYE
jgi:Zn-finger nucleic acid-binding protein